MLEITNDYALYKVTNKDGDIMSIGVEPFKRLTASINAQEQSFLSVIETNADRAELVIKAWELFPDIAHTVPMEEVKSYGQAVFCVETGERFKTMAEAGRTHNLSYSALGKHLKGEKGYNTVKGRTYRRVV